MWSKIFFAVLGPSTAAMLFFTYYSWSWLQSIGLPSAAAAAYEYHANLASWVLVISSAMLLFPANGVLWVTKRAWALWLTFVYIAIFLIVRYFWLGEAYFRFKTANALTDSTYYFGPIMGVVLIIAIGTAVFVNQFVSVRLQNKMYAPVDINEVENEPVTNLEKETEPASKSE